MRNQLASVTLWDWFLNLAQIHQAPIVWALQLCVNEPLDRDTLQSVATGNGRQRWPAHSSTRTSFKKLNFEVAEFAKKEPVVVVSEFSRIQLRDLTLVLILRCGGTRLSGLSDGMVCICDEIGSPL
jgi:hypothetical protein